MNEQTGVLLGKIREVVIMKKFSKLIALALACVMALTMLTACGGAAVENKETVLKALNTARKEASLGEVKMDENLNKAAEAIYKDSSANHQPVIVNGQKYTAHLVTGYTWGSVYVKEDWKATFKKGITVWQDRKSSSSMTSSALVGREDLKYVGIWMGMSNGKKAGCIVIALPEGVSPWH